MLIMDAENNVLLSKFKTQLELCNRSLMSVISFINQGIASCERVNYQDLYSCLYSLLPLFPSKLEIYRNRLRDVILPNLKIKDIECVNGYGQRIMIPNNGINPFVLGQVIATLCYVSDSVGIVDDESFWYNIHSLIRDASFQLYNDAHYAEAVEAAFLEVTLRVKEIVKIKTGEELDGTAAMQKAFSVNSPIIKLGDISTRTGKDIQQGVMELFVGAVRCIRNPKAHGKIVIDKTEAIHELYFASLLMWKIDQAECE